MKIKIFSSFGSTEGATNAMINVFHFDKNLFTQDNDYTHAIILNTAMPELNIPKENVIGLAFEPPQYLGLSNQFIEYAKKHIGKYLIGQPGLPPPFITHFSFMWFVQERTNFLKNIIPPKKKKLSIWASQKNHLFGHQYRHILVKHIIDTNLDIDIWGKGCIYYPKDTRVKGEFNNNEPYRDYDFCISIENCETTDYISEKFMNCIAFNTVPVYIGAKNINKYFPNSFIQLSGDPKQDIQIFSRILNGEYNIDLSDARKRLFTSEMYFPNYIKTNFN